jgi:Ni/Co efflux regulator RcnB
MNKTFRTGALALALLAGSALVAAPAMADRGHDGWNKKSWSKKSKHGGKHYSHRGYGKKGHGYRNYGYRDYGHRGYSRYGYRGPRYGYGWPYVYGGGPGFSIRIY